MGGRHLHLTSRGGGLTLDARASAQRALATGGDVKPVVTAKLDDFLDRLERAGTREPRDATLRYTVTKLKVARARDGLRLDRDAARARVQAAITDPASPRIIRIPLRHLEPEVTRADLADRYSTVVTIHRRGFRLRLFKDLERVASYPVAVGMPGHATPTGRYQIANKAVDPAWTAPDKPWAGAYRNEVVAGERREPAQGALARDRQRRRHPRHRRDLVARRAASHGCIRMSVPAVKVLYPRVPVGRAGHDQVTRQNSITALMSSPSRLKQALGVVERHAAGDEAHEPRRRRREPADRSARAPMIPAWRGRAHRPGEHRIDLVPTWPPRRSGSRTKSPPPRASSRTDPDADVGARLQDAEDQAPVVFLSRPETRNHRSSQRRCSRPTSDSPALPRTSRTPTASRTSSGCSTSATLTSPATAGPTPPRRHRSWPAAMYSAGSTRQATSSSSSATEVPDLGG